MMLICVKLFDREPEIRAMGASRTVAIDDHDGAVVDFGWNRSQTTEGVRVTNVSSSQHEPPVLALDIGGAWAAGEDPSR